MTVQELREHLVGLPPAMTVVVAGEQHFYEIGGLDWPTPPRGDIYLICGAVANGPHEGSSWKQRLPSFDDNS